MDKFKERALRHGEFRLAKALCDLEDSLATIWNRQKAESFVNEIEKQILEE